MKTNREMLDLHDWRRGYELAAAAYTAFATAARLPSARRGVGRTVRRSEPS